MIRAAPKTLRSFPYLSKKAEPTNGSPASIAAEASQPDFSEAVSQSLSVAENSMLAAETIYYKPRSCGLNLGRPLRAGLAFKKGIASLPDA